MSETKHTPTPYVVDDGTDTRDNMAACLMDPACEWVAIGIEDGEGYAESVAYCHPNNAPFIVRACNSHEALCDAVELAIFTLDKVAEACTDRPPNKTQAAFNRAVNSLGTTARLVAALKLARGES
jgi:hypothetical protein